MKRFFSAVALFLGIAGIAFFAYDSVQPLKAADEADRSKEMLEIWKDHVRTLTKERDAAKQRIAALEEQVKSLQVAQSSGGTVPTMVTGQGDEEKKTLVAQKQEAYKVIETLRAHNAKLQAELERKPGNPLKAEASALANQEMVQQLKAKISELEAENKKIQLSRSEADKVRQDKRDFLNDKRDYLTQISDLKEEISRLKDENGRMRGLGMVTNSVDPEKDALRKQHQQLIDESKINEDRAKAEIAALKAEVERLKTADIQINRLKSEKESLQKSYLTLDNSYKAQEQRLRDLSAKAAMAERLNEEMKASQKEKNETISILQTKLQAQSAGLQNFKSNYEKSLNTLLTGYDDGKK